jgi:hypothetical protein
MDTSISIGSRSTTSVSQESNATAGLIASRQAIDLLNAIWRSQCCVHQIGSLDRKNHKFANIPVTGVADAIDHAFAISAAGNDAYFAVAEYQTSDNRQSANVYGAYCYWADIDCGSDKASAGKGYRDNEQARAALSRFCNDAGLPEPNFVVNSGGGLHIYWVLDSFLVREAWQAIAKKLKAIMAALGFLADPTRTADIASILRVPGTLNLKYGSARQVSLLESSDKYIDAKSMCAAIEAAYSRSFPPTAPKPVQPSSDSTSVESATSRLTGPHNIQRLASALAYIDPDCDEPTWALKVIAPLAVEVCHHPELRDDLYELGKLWSSGELTGIPSKAWCTPGNNGKCGSKIFDVKWAQFLGSNYSGTPATLGTIFYLAKQAGWVDPFKCNHSDEFEVLDGEADGGEK